MPADAAVTPQQRITEAAALIQARGAVSGWASAYWRGVRLLDGLDQSMRRQPVLLNVGGRQLRPRPGTTISRERFDEAELWWVRGIPCAASLRTTFDGTRLASDLVEAVVFLDMMLTSRLVELDELQNYIAAKMGWNGVKQARKAPALAVTGSRSPPETRLRLVWVLEAGLPTLLVNQPVFSLHGQLLGYPDGLEPETGCVLEYDGEDHRDLQHHTSDNDREERFADHGLTVMRATRLNLGRDKPALIARMRRAYQRAERRDRGLDRWTLDPPHR